MHPTPATEPQRGDELFEVSPEQRRRELIDDLRRGGYLRHAAAAGEDAAWYFDKYLVLSRPALLARAARVLADLVPGEAERLVVTDVATSALGTALSQQTGIGLLFATLSEDTMKLHGELFSNLRAVLIQDVVHTGSRALAEARGLEEVGADVVCVVALLDRESGGAARLGEEGHLLRALFVESELLAPPVADAF
jgi:orotate phosphoribosyltransferase